ncbi:MAG: carbohydrate binding family 9 domain-containing protein [Chlorobi bacterium]|nr:carbohydrate binding family 9 domain-containing protein [Chlorobiota bacterium]
MKKILLFGCLILIQFLIGLGLYAQKSIPSSINAFYFSGKLRFDGLLDEPEWQTAKRISNFTQRDLDYGMPITERTEVAILYNSSSLFVGVWCFHGDSAKIVAKNMSLDFNYREDDNFQLMISPFDDNRNGYLFVTNPNGARADIQIYSGEDGNQDWNGVWDVKTSITSEGWFAEIEIPFSTLQFKKGRVLEWAINFERDIVSKNEQALWQGWSRDNSIYAVVNAGQLIGIHDIAYSRKFEFKPYGLVGWQYDSDEGSSYPLKAGADLNINLSPTLKLNLTTFTDFAQVESDRIPVNLSRFSVYYPEQRQFFLEGYDLYSFYLGDRNNAFYSRTIGIKDGKQVPILFGTRLFGKLGKNNIGFLNIQEAKIDTTPTTNNTVLRYKRDIGEQSQIGGIFTNVINKGHSNQVVGLDAVYQTSKLFKNKNLVVEAKIASSLQDLTLGGNAITYRLSVDYPNDLIDNFMAVAAMQKDFKPELGFLRRSNYNSYSWYLRITPRWFTGWGVKRMLFKPWGLTVYRTLSTGELESVSNETRPFGAILKSGERFEINFIQNFDRLDENFEVTDHISIPTGRYWMYNYEFQFETYQSRRIWIALLYNFGGFYTGKIKTFESELGLNISKHLNVNGQYTWNKVNLPQGDFITHELATYLNYAFTTRLNFTLFGQFNSLENIMIYNIRLHWIPEIGSDLYFVYNIGYEEPVKQIDYLKPETTSAVVKLIYRMTF